MVPPTSQLKVIKIDTRTVKREIRIFGTDSYHTINKTAFLPPKVYYKGRPKRKTTLNALIQCKMLKPPIWINAPGNLNVVLSCTPLRNPILRLQ